PSIPATARFTALYTLSLHDALPISSASSAGLSAGFSAGLSAALSAGLVAFLSLFLVFFSWPGSTRSFSTAWNSASSASRSLSSATWRGVGARRLLNFCQSPVLRKRALTASEGCAPTDSQYCTRSELSSMRLGCSLGWYLPISSIALPSRLFRASATMTRYWGVRIFPIRLSFSLTATGVVSPVIRCWAPDGEPRGAANPRRDRTWATSKLEGRLVHRWSTLQLCQTRKGSSARTAARVVTSIDAGRPVARGPRPRGEARGTTCPCGTRSPSGRAISE